MPTTRAKETAKVSYDAIVQRSGWASQKGSAWEEKEQKTRTRKRPTTKIKTTSPQTKEKLEQEERYSRVSVHPEGRD